MSLTLRARGGLPSLRSAPVFPVVRDCIAAASRDGFRVVAFSVQRDHVHLVIEARDHARMVSGIRSLSIRSARAVNRLLGVKGRFWGDRYHARDLRSPLEVRNALVYVLRNVRKHHPATPATLDPCSSAAWFSGFVNHVPSAAPSPVQPPLTWLAAVGWRRHGPIQPHEAPAPRARKA